MKDYTLSNGKIAELERLHRSLRDKRQADRVKAVLALSKGWSPAQVAEILLFDEKTSRHYFERYQQGGTDALLNDSYSGTEPKLNEHQLRELEHYLEVHLFADAKSVIAHIYNCQRLRITLAASRRYGMTRRAGLLCLTANHPPSCSIRSEQRLVLSLHRSRPRSTGRHIWILSLLTLH